MRRIKSVALSIPSVVGPYTSINCTLSLLKSSLRKSPSFKDGNYERQGSEDDRFMDYIGSLQSIVTSGASNDSGMFETNLRDERFLPFEGSGAESTWKLDLLKDYRPFDYNTISDVILHIRYTARQGVDPTKVKTTLDTLFQDVNGSNLTLLFSLRHDFSSDEKDVTKHHLIGSQSMWDTATAELADENKQAFVVSIPADPPGPTQILTRTPAKQVYLIVRYLLS